MVRMECYTWIDRVKIDGGPQKDSFSVYISNLPQNAGEIRIIRDDVPNHQDCLVSEVDPDQPHEKITYGPWKQVIDKGSIYYTRVEDGFHRMYSI